MLNDLIQNVEWPNPVAIVLKKPVFQMGLQNVCKTVETVGNPRPFSLRSQSEVAGYLGGRVQVKDKSQRPPGLTNWHDSVLRWIAFHDLTFYHFSVPISRLPWKDDLIDTNKLFVPNLENLANIVGTRPLKRPAGDHGGGAAPGEEKRNCPEPQPLLPL